MGQLPISIPLVKCAALGLSGLCLTFACGCSATTASQGTQTTTVAQSTDHFGYMVASRLVTTNAASAFGVASNAQVLSGRLYPAVFVPGPDGQLIPNRDLATAEEIAPNEQGQRQVHYRISDKAVYSDGVPVTCEDYLLAYTAGSMPSTFGSHLPLVREVEDMQCAAGKKDFVVVFKQGQGERWKYMFGPGTVMPSHSIARKLGITQEDLVTQLRTWDPATVEGIAKEWRWGFMLGNFDPSVQVSFGPYVVDHVGESGEVVLKRNESYYGDKASLETIVVWPNTADAKNLVDTGALKIADSTGGTPAWLDRNVEGSPYEVSAQVGELTDTLIFSDTGTFSAPESRRAFAACVDQAALAKVSSEVSGTIVEPSYEHALRHNDPIAKQLDGVVMPQKGVDMTLASQLSGTTVRVGYLGPDSRYSAMVAELKRSCALAGINVEDANSDFMSATYLQPSPDTGLPTIDVFFGAIDPMTEYSTVDAKISRVEALKTAEASLWQDVPSVPVAAQPRTFVIDRSVSHVVPYTGLTGIGWNMDRWSVESESAAH